MTNAGGAGVVLEYRFRDSFSFRVRLAELFDREISMLLQRLSLFHGAIVSISEPALRR
jgi:hypothetical protein